MCPAFAHHGAAATVQRFYSLAFILDLWVLPEQVYLSLPVLIFSYIFAVFVFNVEPSHVQKTTFKYSFALPVPADLPPSLKAPVGLDLLPD